uniref:Uncharacterized protein n=1 Tax=Rhizophora mucronata TaxID=61149 RepID=A0A2P2JEX9_RHIMU
MFLLHEAPDRKAKGQRSKSKASTRQGKGTQGREERVMNGSTMLMQKKR